MEGGSSLRDATCTTKVGITEIVFSFKRSDIKCTVAKYTTMKDRKSNVPDVRHALQRGSELSVISRVSCVLSTEVNLLTSGFLCTTCFNIMKF